MIGRAVNYIRRDVQEAIQYSLAPLKDRQAARARLYRLPDEQVSRLYERHGLTANHWLKELLK